MKTISKIIIIAMTGMLVQACAPKAKEKPEETWWRVTPVDIADYSSQTLYNCASTVDSTQHFSSTDPQCEGHTVLGEYLNEPTN